MSPGTKFLLRRRKHRCLISAEEQGLGSQGVRKGLIQAPGVVAARLSPCCQRSAA
jgi:hypothetical protein